MLWLCACAPKQASENNRQSTIPAANPTAIAKKINRISLELPGTERKRTSEKVPSTAGTVFLHDMVKSKTPIIQKQDQFISNPAIQKEEAFSCLQVY